MATPLRLTKPSFKDYFLILQVHPEADGAMVNAAYWHLARRYSEEAVADPSAKRKLDELNEAYSVLGSGESREEYMRLRAEVLGAGALPELPEIPRAPQPLAIMDRQKPKPRERPAPGAKPRRGRVLPFRVPARQNALAAVVMLTLASAGLASQVYPPLVIGLLILGLSLTSIPLVRKIGSLPMLSRASPKFPARPNVSAGKRRDGGPSHSGRLRAASEAMVAGMRDTPAVPPRREDRAKPAKPKRAKPEPVSAGDHPIR